MERNFYLFLLHIILSFSKCSITFAHSQTAFQGKNSILSQEEILTPFPLKHENNSALKLGNFWATLTADKNLITGDSFLLFQVVVIWLLVSNNKYQNTHFIDLWLATS